MRDTQSKSCDSPRAACHEVPARPVVRGYLGQLPGDCQRRYGVLISEQEIFLHDPIRGREERMTRKVVPSPSGLHPEAGSPLGLHRVIEPSGVLPQAAWRLEPYRPGTSIAADEVLVRVDRLNLDAASYRQIRETYAGDPDKIRAAVLEIIATRGKMQNPVTGSGGMLTGTVEQAGRSEEHTSELQSLTNLVCRLLL